MGLVGLLLAIVGGKAAGYAVLVDHSDSMQPAIAAGDVVITRLIPSREIAVGDIVSFRSPQRPQILITHRVVERRAVANGFAFVTRGDANTGVERWTIDDEGRIGMMVGRAPKLGFVLHWIKGPFAGIGLVLLSGLLLTGLLIRRVIAL